MKTVTAFVFAIAIAMASGAASAQGTAGIDATPPTLAQGGVGTAPTPRAPTGVTVDQGAGVPGMATSPAAPHPSTPHPHGPDDPQAGMPGIQDPSQQG